MSDCIGSVVVVSCMFDSYWRHFFYSFLMYAARCISHTAGKDKKTSIKTLRCPLTAEFWRHCVLSAGTQRRALP